MTGRGDGSAGAVPPTVDDHRLNGAANVGFGIALGIGTVAVPLVALAAGYDAVAVGLLVATSAASQLTIRLLLPRLLRRFADRTLLVAASALLAAAYGLLLVSTSAPVFGLAQCLHGVARGTFWTSSQTHAVRGAGSTVRSLAQMNAMSNVGTMAGPALAGALATIALPLALLVGAVIAGLTAGLALLLQRLPPFERRTNRPGVRLWREPGVLTGSLATFTTGGWQALLGSYVPVVLTGAGIGPALVGALVAVAEAAAMVASATLVRYDRTSPVRPMRLGVLAMGLVVALLPFVAAEPLVAGLLLALGGAGHGLVFVLALALVADAVEPAARGEALSLAGTFRALGLLIAPSAIATALAVVPLGWALVGAGVVMGGTPLLVGRRIGQSPPDAAARPAARASPR